MATYIEPINFENFPELCDELKKDYYISYAKIDPNSPDPTIR